MSKKDISIFKEALIFVKDDFVFDAINSFQFLVDNYPNSEFADDALYNIGLCYFEIGNFLKAIDFYDIVIRNYPSSKINSSKNNNEYGLTSSKCHLSKIHCFIALNQLEKAKKELKFLEKDKNSYIMVRNQKVTFYSLGNEAIKLSLK